MATLKKKKIISVRVPRGKSRRLNGSGSRLKTPQKKTVKKTVAKISVLDLKRSKKNPIIEPESHKYWESKAAFNPSAIYHDGKIHIIYRAIGDSDISVLGYARSNDGYSFDKDSKEMAYYSKAKQVTSGKLSPQILYSSGGGWGGGCEDPRLTLIGNRVYMLYTSFDGWGSLRIALTSISLNDFISRRWDWKEPVLISPPGEIHKNWVLFPEKINGKYAILHSFAPKILVDYFDSLEELNGKKFIKSNNTRPVDTTRTWDSWFRGVGPAPIKTKYGWLIIYHAMDHRNPDRYRIGAMILDIKDLTKVLYRSKEPILEPEEWYENEGYKSGVVYSCGAVVKGGELFVYYGGADKVSCVATANLNKFLEELISNNAYKLKSTARAGEKKK
ncbi:MAG: glycosidase [Candidatus Nomurabacteria bacterium]|nr:glycosidase [Candidatus Nomurabacteria bacterium]